MKSCVGCVFLYKQAEGYSNYTVVDVFVYCAYCANPNLPQSDPYDWIDDDPAKDNWPATQDSRCELYTNVGVQVEFDVDGRDGTAEHQIGTRYPLFAIVIDHHKEHFQ